MEDRVGCSAEEALLSYTYQVSRLEYRLDPLFTDGEVRAMLECCGAAGKYEAVRQWYDGYRFGSVNVYCPWDVINFCDRFLDDPDAEPESCWMNSSSNSIVRKLIEYSGNATVLGELECLVNGGVKVCPPSLRPVSDPGHAVRDMIAPKTAPVSFPRPLSMERYNTIDNKRRTRRSSPA